MIEFIGGDEMVQSYVLMRANGSGADGDEFGPRKADLQPYVDMAGGPLELQLEDMSGRANIAIEQTKDAASNLPCE